MKIECVKEKFLEAVQKVEKVTGKNVTLPILSCIHIEATNSQVILRATNLDIGIEISLPVKVIEPGSVALSGNILSQFLLNLPKSEKCTLETEEGVVLVSTEHTTAKIKTQNTEDFPLIPKTSDGVSVNIEAQNFIKGLRSVWYSAAVTSMKPEISSVYVYYDNQDSLFFVATDSFRLAEKQIKIKKIKEFSPILIPFKNVTEIIRALEDVSSSIEIVIGQNQIAFLWEGAYMVSRIVDASFPDYKQLISKEEKTEATVLKQDFSQALKLAHVFSDSFNQVTIKIVPGDKVFEIITRNNDVGENKNSIDAVLKGEDVTMSFNHKYITDCLQSIAVDSLTLSFNGQGRPLVIRGVSDTSFTYIVMPMNK